ncbi:MAG: FecR domain-containing protein [Verrucomicrobiales bacterium]|nr:FecR domain-containing protein [Verrucomicrobiales bacterium]
MKDDSLDGLILGHLDERLSAEEFEALETLLKNDPEARAQYVKFAELDSNLRSATDEPVAQILSIKRWLIPGILASFVLFVCIATIFKDRVEELARPTYETVGVAVLSAQANAEWRSSVPNFIPAKDMTLEPGRYQLNSGLAQIDFFGGAAISLSGPADIELINRNEAILHRGRLRANVPPAARGFKIRSADVVIEDLGTSFGLATREGESAEVVVFDGEVRTLDTNGESLPVMEGQSARLQSGQSILVKEASRESFPDIADVLTGSDNSSLVNYANWKEDSQIRRNDPRLIAYYDFENLTSVSRRLKNRAGSIRKSELDGGIVGARVTDGRWPGKTALDFRSEGDRVRFQIPGEFPELTICIWVRIDALDRHLNSLFLTDYFDPYEFHWQLSREGALHFASSPTGVEDLEENTRRFFSKPFWNSSRSGKWYFLATSVSRETGVNHYINGKRTGFSGGTNQGKPLMALRIGKADLGNWSEPIHPNSKIRTLNGRIDEFALYRAVLTLREIVAFYESGKP